MMQRLGTIQKQPAGYMAFMPKMLTDESYDIKRDKELTVLLSEADRSLAWLDGNTQILPDIDFFIFMYMKKESLLSSQIEGTQASLEGVLEFEADLKPKRENINDIKEVTNYQRAMDYGIRKLKEFPMSLRVIKEIHEILLKDTRGKHKEPGNFRQTQNWIGPPGASLAEASFIPPPPRVIMELMGDLEKYFYLDDNIPLLEKIAIIHYQFETIHPFLDGNGRIGRLLITFYLLWKKILTSPVLYLSYYFKKNKTQYYEILTAVRKEGRLEDWIKFFLKGVIEVCGEAAEASKTIINLREKLIETQSAKSVYAVKLINYMFRRPVISAGDISGELNISKQTANVLIKEFESAGILMEITGKKRWRKYIFEEYIAIIKKGTEL